MGGKSDCRIQLHQGETARLLIDLGDRAVYNFECQRKRAMKNDEAKFLGTNLSPPDDHIDVAADEPCSLYSQAFTVVSFVNC